MHSGYHTHGVGLDQRLVKLVVQGLSADGKTLTVVGPPNAQIYPPGVGFVYVLASGVPSVGQKTLIGNGAPPPSNAQTTANMLQQTSFISRIAAIAAQRITNNTTQISQAWDPNNPSAFLLPFFQGWVADGLVQSTSPKVVLTFTRPRSSCRTSCYRSSSLSLFSPSLDRCIFYVDTRGTLVLFTLALVPSLNFARRRRPCPPF